MHYFIFRINLLQRKFLLSFNVTHALLYYYLIITLRTRQWARLKFSTVFTLKRGLFNFYWVFIMKDKYTFNNWIIIWKSVMFLTLVQIVFLGDPRPVILTIEEQRYWSWSQRTQLLLKEIPLKSSNDLFAFKCMLKKLFFFLAFHVLIASIDKCTVFFLKHIYHPRWHSFFYFFTHLLYHLSCPVVLSACTVTVIGLEMTINLLKFKCLDMNKLVLVA